jgi:hypothetical protein
MRMLRRHLGDPASIARRRDPHDPRLWIAVWPDAEAAERFHRELEAATGDPDWTMFETQTAAEAGPLGPVYIQVARRHNGWVFGLHPLSRRLVAAVFPESPAARNPVDNVTVDAATRGDWSRTQGDLSELAREMAVVLTGVDWDRLNAGLGLIFVDSDTGCEPADLSPAEPTVANA